MSMMQVLEEAKHEAFLENFDEQIRKLVKKSKKLKISDETIILAFQTTFKVDIETAFKMYEAVK